MSTTQQKVIRRKAKYSKNADVEHQLQVAQIAWTEWQGKIWPELRAIYSVPNQSLRSVQGYQRMTDEGLKKGQWDLCLPVARRGFGALYVENKTPILPGKLKTKLSAKQIERGEILTSVGNLCYVIRAHDHFVNLVTWYLGYEDPAQPIAFTQGELWEYVDPLAYTSIEY